MITVGGRGPSRPGVLVPFAPGWDDGALLNLSGAPGPWVAFMLLSWLGWPGWPATPALLWSPARTTLFGGRGLLRMSLTVEVDEEGVRTGDWLDSLETGDWVPSLESLFFLEDLPESLPRESCALVQCQHHSNNNKRNQSTRRSSAPARKREQKQD